MSLSGDSLLVIRDDYPDLDAEVRSILIARAQNGATISDIKDDYRKNFGLYFPILQNVTEYLLSIPSVSAVCTPRGTLIFNIMSTEHTNDLPVVRAPQQIGSIAPYSYKNIQRRLHAYIEKTCRSGSNIELQQEQQHNNNSNDDHSNNNSNSDKSSNAVINQPKPRFIASNSRDPEEGTPHLYQLQDIPIVTSVKVFYNKNFEDIISKNAPINNQNKTNLNYREQQQQQNPNPIINNNNLNNNPHTTNNTLQPSMPLWDSVLSSSSQSETWSSQTNESIFATDSHYEAHILDFLLLGDDFFLHLARKELKCKLKPFEKVQQSGLCVSGQTIRAAIKRVSRLQKSNKQVIVNIGSVDIMQGRNLLQIEHDFRDLVHMMLKKGLTPILTTLSPLANYGHDPSIKQLIQRFNEFIKREGKDLRVIDIWSCLVNNRQQTLFGCFENVPRSVTGTSEKYMFWNETGRQRVLKSIEANIEY